MASEAGVVERLEPAVGTKGPPYATLRMLGVAVKGISPPKEAAYAHAGLLYRWKGEVRLFELQSHKELLNGPAPRTPGPFTTAFVWIEPEIPPERLRLVIHRARLVHSAHQSNAVPYGFGYRRSSFDERGGYRLGEGEIGFTCSTIVAAVLEAERVPLIDPLKWPPPDGADKAARVAFLGRLKRKDPAHAKALSADLDAPRICPEEVVAAAAMHPTVGTFDTLLEGSAEVRRRIGT